MKKLIIEQLKEGFLFSDENDEMYAVSSNSLSKRVLAYFGLTRHDSHKEIGTKNNIAPPAKVQRDATSSKLGSTEPKAVNAELQPANSDTVPETQGSTTPDSHSGGATSQSSSTEHIQMQHDIEGINKDPELKGNKAANDVMKGSILNETKLGTPDKIHKCLCCMQPLDKCNCITSRSPMPVLQPSDLKIAKFDYDLLAKTRKYKTLEVLELPDGRVVLKYGAVRYYSTKEKVMQIPFPFPRGSFSKEGGWSSNVEQAFKMYRRYLAERKEPEGQPDGTCDDVSFETCANNDPEACKFCMNESRYEDKRKLAAKKPRAPLLKAHMGV